jgi:hypothetical protein
MVAKRDNVVRHSVEALAGEIAAIVAERQELREAGASPTSLEENRRRLVDTQARLSRLLIERHLRGSNAA